MAESSPQLFTSKESALLGWMNDFAPYGVITTDSELKIQGWNRWMEIHSDLLAVNVVGDNLLDLFPDIVQRRLSSRIERALHGEISVLSTALHGHLIPLASAVKASGFPYMRQTARIGPLVQGNVVLGAIIIIEDVTQREMQAAILRRQHERDQILSWALAHLLEAGNPRRTVRELFFKVAAHFDYEAYFLYLNDGDNHLSLHDTGGLPPEIQKAFSESKITRHFWGDDDLIKPLIVRESADWPQGSGIKVAIAVPLLMGELSLGVLCFATKSREIIHEGEVDLLSTISQYLALAIHRSNTDQQLREAKEKLLQHADNLEREVALRTSRLREIVSELEIFSYSMAHDLRAPIRALIGYCDVLKEDYEKVIPAEPMEIVDRLSGACKKLDSLTRDLLQFSKISRADIELRQISTQDLVMEVLSIYSQEVRRRITVAGPLHNVVAHRGLLHQCIANLIENALKFVPSGEQPFIIIRSEIAQESTGKTGVHSLPFSKAVYAQIRPQQDTGKPMEGPATTSPQRVKLWIEDKGIGIPEEAHEKIFGIFERANSSEEFPGTGIGLAIVARAMERMDGRCGVESVPGEGSRFWLELHRST